MKRKVALIVIYNHNYEENIPKIRKIYGERFSCILQIMPFYRGDDAGVVGVYEASWQFNGYLAQALSRILQMGDCSHYVVIGDDFILHPELNEWNLCDKLGLDDQSAYVDRVRLINEDELASNQWAQYSYDRFLNSYNRTEFKRFIPTYDEARAHCKRHGFDWEKGLPGYVLHNCLEERQFRFYGLRRICRNRIMSLIAVAFIRVEITMRKIFRCNVDKARVFKKYNSLATDRKLSEDYHYPLFEGLADFMVIPASKMESFAHLCGVFAAARLFVETAIPTAFVFTMDKIRSIRDTSYKPAMMWGDERNELVRAHDGRFSHLIENWPLEILYYHPVKLSQWKFDI